MIEVQFAFDDFRDIIERIHALFFYRAMDVACDGCPAWLGSNKRASENKRAMGTPWAQISISVIARLIFFLYKNVKK